MCDDDNDDKLIDMLLREELGGEQPPSQRARIMQRARKEKRARKFPILPLISAAAAAALIAWLILPKLFTQPATAPVTQKTIETPPPKSSDQTPKAPAPLIVQTSGSAQSHTLGGFCRVEVAPNSKATLSGEGKAQKIVLSKGRVNCDVDKGVGSVSVETELGAVAVKGTKFSVEIVERSQGHHELATSGRQTVVSVTEGRVELFAPWGKVPVEAGETAGVMTGILVNKNVEWIEVKADGDKEQTKLPPRWIGKMPNQGGGLDKTMLARIKQLAAPNRVQIMWINQEEGRRLIAVDLIEPVKKEGSVTGTVTALGDAWIEVKPAGAPADRYMVAWKPGKGPHGEPDRDMIRQLQHFKPGSEVELQWTYDERKRIVKIGKPAN